MTVEYNPNAANEQFVAGLENEFPPLQPPARLPDVEPGDDEPAGSRQHTIPEENFIPTDRFNELSEQFPEVAQELKRRKRETEALLKQIERREEMLQQAHSKLVTPNGKQESTEDEKWAQFTDEQLHDYLDSVDKLQAAAVSNPDDDEIKAESAKIQPKHVRAVRTELSRRAVRSELKGWREEQKKKERASVMATTAEQLIAEQFGPKALMDSSPGSPLHRARELVQEVTVKFNITDDNPEAVAALAVMAMRQAYAEQEAQSRAGSGRGVPPSLTRQLELEGTSRRSAHVDSERSAMERRGDWDGVLLHDITRMLQS